MENQEHFQWSIGINQQKNVLSSPIEVEIMVKIWVCHGIFMEMHILSWINWDNFEKYCTPKFNDILAVVKLKYLFQNDQPEDFHMKGLMLIQEANIPDNFQYCYLHDIIVQGSSHQKFTNNCVNEGDSVSLEYVLEITHLEAFTQRD